ncbi:amidohydrolase [Burkholderia sp. L27(2015)]|uniref:amidohydrolase family protein n=1 Tax=Burkholderia sp. L27(2015) TaxID=1641858 RepID=UPI00131B2985|nr:amidohydrolase family protein [Burkholderia sp. L27(2015)]
MHVFGALDRFPGVAGHSYAPRPARIDDWKRAFTSLGIQRLVVVQPSCYGTDNRCLLETLLALDGCARGVVDIDSSISERELMQLHDAGVRGVRVNARSVGARDPVVLSRRISEIAERISPYRWHVQIYADLDVITAMSDVLRDAPCPIVLDHMGGARVQHTSVDLQVLCALLREGNCWVKLSGAYRVSEQREGFADSIQIARTLLDSNAERIVWGSDWPHTTEHASRPQKGASQIAFRDIDETSLLELLAEQCDDPARFARVLAKNAAVLYQF